MSTTMHQFWFLAVVVIAGSTSSCSSVDADSGPAASVSAGLVAEADLYSGRENPTWSLESTVADVVNECLEVAASTSARIDAPSDGLGFRGVVVRGITIDGDADGSLRSLPDVTTVSANGEDYTVRSCPDLYPALVESARTHLTAAEIKLIPKGPNQ